MKKLSIVLIAFHSIFLVDCSNTFHRSYINYSSEISSDCLKVKIKVDNPKFSWKINRKKENVNIHTTFYNNCSEDILIYNPISYGKDGRFSVIDSSGTELEENWIDVFYSSNKYSILRGNDSLTLPIIFPNVNKSLLLSPALILSILLFVTIHLSPYKIQKFFFCFFGYFFVKTK